MTSKEPTGTSKTAQKKKKKTAKRLIFQRRQKSWGIFLNVMKPLLSLIAFTRYRVMWGIHNTLSLFHNPEKTASRQLSVFKITLLTVCGCFSSFEVTIVSQRFYLRYHDMWGVQYTLSCSNTLEKVSHDFHFFEYPPFDHFVLLWLCFTFLMAQWGTLTCKESRTLWVSPITLKKCVKTIVSFENHPFGQFW